MVATSGHWDLRHNSFPSKTHVGLLRMSYVFMVICVGPLALAGCSKLESEVLGTTHSPVVYGSDDRVDVYAHPSSEWRTLAMRSVVTLMAPDVIDMSDSSDITFSSETLDDRLGLCNGERFADQPTAGHCSGTLIDDDLVLTAGHCVETDADCRNTRVVFNYYYESQGRLATVTSDDVYSCSHRRAYALEDTQDGSLDYAIIQLDRPVTSDHVPATVNADTRHVSEGLAVSVIGSGSGLPQKIDTGGSVRNARASARDFFVTNLDTFGGNSGSGVFDTQSRALVGILVSGDTDYVEQGGCTMVNECSSDGCGGESVTYVANALNEFCDSYTSSRLCGTEAVCGDGFCASSEDEDSCSDDCEAAECGNGVCEAGEAGSCEEDCETGTAAGWTCEPSYYGTRDGCDCNCGTRDPDCDLPEQLILNCSDGEICNAGGSCATPGAGDCGNDICDGDETAGSCPHDCGGEIPAAWVCDPDYYGELDGCDCECGAYDPDCDDADEELYGCAEGATCNSSGTCSVQAWSCDPAYYDALDGCDCDCGLWDPDCEFIEQELLNCDEGEFCSAEGRCSLTGERPVQRSQSGCQMVAAPSDANPLWLLGLLVAGLVRMRRRS